MPWVLCAAVGTGGAWGEGVTWGTFDLGKAPVELMAPTQAAPRLWSPWWCLSPAHAVLEMPPFPLSHLVSPRSFSLTGDPLPCRPWLLAWTWPHLGHGQGCLRTAANAGCPQQAVPLGCLVSVTGMRCALRGCGQGEGPGSGYSHPSGSAWAWGCTQGVPSACLWAEESRNCPAAQGGPCSWGTC